MTEATLRIANETDAPKSCIIKAEVRRLAKDRDHQLAADFLDTLNSKINGMLDDAMKRASSNGRKQLRSHDL